MSIRTGALSLETIIFRMLHSCCRGYCLFSGLCTADHILVYIPARVRTRALFVSVNERIGTRMAHMNVLSVEQYHTKRAVGRADPLHARKQSVAWPPHSDIADYYLQSVVRFRCLLHYYDGVYMFGGSLPCAVCIFISLLEGIIRRQFQYPRLPVAVKPTSMHVLVCAYTYEGPIFIIMDTLCTTAVSYSTMMTCIRYVVRSTVFTRILRGGAKYHTRNDITATRRDGQDSHDAIISFFIVMSPPLYTHIPGSRYHEAPLIRCEWRGRVDRQTTIV